MHFVHFGQTVREPFNAKTMPRAKLQAPKTKLERTSKFQTPKLPRVGEKNPEASSLSLGVSMEL
ncbi:MAG: hypothetical protein DME25_01350 [Verrucomicrobia bacterium]|nr:MAG: hypothetical protein DME25_01350 [Verrucomicrobiota bacterium]